MNTNTCTQKKRAVAYIRVSTDKEEQKSSLANQREFFEQYVAGQGNELIRIYCDEAKSGTKMKNRTELNAMLRAAKVGEFDILYVKDISRLFRNVHDFINVTKNREDCGVAVFFVDLGMNVDPMVRPIMAYTAQNESEKMSTRIKFAKNISKQKGIVPNFVFGYRRIDKFTLEPDPVEADIVRLIFDKYTEEGWGQARIAQYLHEHGVVTKKMKEDAWSQHTVGGILQNQIYIGRVVNGRETTRGALESKRDQHPESEWIVVQRPEFRIISDEQFSKAQAIREENNKKFFKDRTRRSEKHLFSNLIKCGSCGFSYRRIQRQHTPNGPVYAWWTCSKRQAYGSGRCTAEHIRLDEDWLTLALRQLLGSMIDNKEQFFDLVERKCNAILKDYLASTSALSLDEINQRISDLELQRSKIKEMVVRNMVDIEEAEKDMIPLNDELAKLKMKRDEADKTKEVTAQVRESIKRFLREFSALSVTENLDNADLRKIIDKIVVNSKDNIVVHFKAGFDGDGITVPMKLMDSVTIDTNSKHGTQGPKRAAGRFQPAPLPPGPGRPGGKQGPAPHPGRHCHPQEVQRSVNRVRETLPPPGPLFMPPSPGPAART